MPKFVKVERPTVAEAIQWNHDLTINLRKGDWVILHGDGSTTTCGPAWFKEHYMEVK